MVVLFLLFMGLNSLNVNTSDALLQGAINRYIYIKSSTGGDGYNINETVVEYVGIKEGPKEVGGGFKYCATFKRGNDYYEVDFYIAEKNGTYKVVKESLHKMNGRSVNDILWEAEAPAMSLDLPLEVRLEVVNERVAALRAE